jgi:hypothetical protein
VNNIISGIGLYLLGVLTGVLTPLAASNASIALELRSKIDEVLYYLGEYEARRPGDTREELFEEMGSDLKQALASVRWYLIFQFLLGLPPKDNVLAAIEKLSEMTRCLRAATPEGRFDLERRAQAPTLGREVKEHLKRRWSPF